MNTGKLTGLIILSLLVFVLVPLSASGGKDETPIRTMDKTVHTDNGAIAVFAGGCFWGVEAVFESLNGVIDVQSGYSGGPEELATYKMVTSGTTGHAESVLIEYDPELIDFETLLEIFFMVAHDPTQLNYQGPDRGPQYRSAIFYNSDEQRRQSLSFIEKLEREKTYRDPVVTEISELKAFYPAEEYHQDFMERNPNHPYIVYWDVPKIRDLNEKYPDLLKKSR